MSIPSKTTIALTLALLVTIPALAHTYNHQDRHVECEIDVAPEHSVDDGHTHFHHSEPSGAHWHGGTHFSDGHTHESHNHDPCKQTGMEIKDYNNEKTYHKVFLKDAAIGKEGENNKYLISDYEAFAVENREMIEHDAIWINGDMRLDRMADRYNFPGDGTEENPYIIEDRIIRHALVIKDTSKCVVIKNNVIHSRAIEGPVVSINDIVYLPAVIEQIEEEIEIVEYQIIEAEELGDNELLQELTQKLTERRTTVTQIKEVQRDGAYELYDQQAATVDELIETVVKQIQDEKAKRAGALVLNWNGQCVHVHNNIIEDLRVNQNNKRTGYATGGVIEDNRIYRVGQIRHYDGEFRENEVGYPQHVMGLLPNEDANKGSVRAMNTDGFNQGWFHDNLFYGSVDLDFHGHHHGAGFFAPESHYHGADDAHAYMIGPDGECIAKASDYHEHHNNEHEHDPFDMAPVTTPPVTQPPVPILEATMHSEDGCLPHHNHQLRWTSARFNDNVIVDPYGYGLRYEDRNHQGDDRYANSESMEELNAPHFHRTYIDISDNLVLGAIWIDIFNSPSIDVWSDDYSEVDRSEGGSLQDAIDHMGAKPIPSHPERNDGWVTIENNQVILYDKPHNTRGFHYGWTAYQLNSILESTQEFNNNKAYLLENQIQLEQTHPEFIELLLSLKDKEHSKVAQEIDSWALARERGPTTYSLVLHHVDDSIINICNTQVNGFDRHIYARNHIYDNSQINICQNDDQTINYMRYSEKPQQEDYLITGTLRGFTDDTSLQPFMDKHYGLLGEHEKLIAVYEKWATENSENVNKWADMQLETLNSWTAIQQDALQKEMYETEYHLAGELEKTEWMLTYGYEEEDYDAANEMVFEDWINQILHKYSYSTPIKVSATIAGETISI